MSSKHTDDSHNDTDDSDMAALIANDPALRQLIEESSWQSMVSGGAASAESNRILSVLLGGTVPMTTSIDDDQSRLRFGDIVGNKENPKATATAASSTFPNEGALGIRRDANGKMIMHIDPTGVFFGGGAQDTGGGGDQTQLQQTHQQLDDGGNDDEEAFDHEMTADDIAFYDELRQMVEVRDRLLSRVAEQREEQQQEVVKADLVVQSNDEEGSDSDSSSDTTTTKDDVEDEEFLNKVRQRTQLLFQRYVEKAQQQSGKQEQGGGGGARRRGAGRVAAKNNNSASATKTPPAIAQLLREIKQEAEETGNESLLSQLPPSPTSPVEKRRRRTVAEIEDEIVSAASRMFAEGQPVKDENANHQQQEAPAAAQSDTKIVVDLLQQLGTLTDECLDSVIALAEADLGGGSASVVVSARRQDDKKGENDEDDDETQQEQQNEEEETALDRLAVAVLQPLAAADLRGMQQFFTESDTTQLRLFSQVRKEITQLQLARQAEIFELEQQLAAAAREVDSNALSPGEKNNSNNNTAAARAHNPTHAAASKISKTRLTDQMLLADTELTGEGGTDVAFDAREFAVGVTTTTLAAPAQHQQQQKQDEEQANRRLKKLSQRRCMRERREAAERAAMSEIDQRLQRLQWMAERTEAEHKAAVAALLDAEGKERMAIRSEESTRSHDTRIRETRQRAILSEWQQHMTQQKQSEARRSVEGEAEPQLRQKLRDVECVAWAELFSSFEEQRLLIEAEAKNKQEQRQREEREQRAMAQLELERVWNELKSDAVHGLTAVQIASTATTMASSGSSNHDSDNERQLLEKLRENVSAAQQRRSKLTRRSSCVAEVASAMQPSQSQQRQQSEKDLDSFSLSEATAEFLDQVFAGVALRSVRSLSHSSISSVPLLTSLPADVTASAFFTLKLTQQRHGLVDMLCSLASSSEQQHDVIQLASLTQRQLQHCGPEIVQLHLAARCLLKSVNVIDAASTTATATQFPCLLQLETLCEALVAVDVHGNKGIRFGSNGSSSGQQQQTGTTTKRHGTIRYLNVSDCGLESFDGIFFPTTTTSTEATSLQHLAVLLCSHNNLAGSLADHFRRGVTPPLSHLVVLDLSANTKLDDIDCEALASATQLQVLDVSDCAALSTLPKFVLQSVSLRVLRAAGTALKAVNTASGRCSEDVVWPMMEEIDFSRCSQLEHIVDAAADASSFFAPSLRRADFRGSSNVSAREFFRTPLQQPQQRSFVVYAPSLELLDGEKFSSQQSENPHQRFERHAPLFSFVSQSLRLCGVENLSQQQQQQQQQQQPLLLLHALQHSHVVSDALDQLAGGLLAAANSSSFSSSTLLQRRNSAVTASSSHAAAAASVSAQFQFVARSSRSLSSSLQLLSQRIRINRAAVLLTQWWRRCRAFRVLAERAQRKIAPMWRGAWTRMRLKKVRGNDDDLFDIPDHGGGVDGLLAGLTDTSAGGAKSLVEMLRSGSRVNSNNNNNSNATRPTLPFAPHPPTSSKPTTTANISSSSSTNLFVIRNSNINDGPSLFRAATPIPTSGVVIPARAGSAAVAVSAAGGVSSVSANNPRSNSATVARNNNGDDDADNGNSGWSSAIQDLLKYRDRKRHAAQSARERQEWLRQGGLAKRGGQPK